MARRHSSTHRSVDCMSRVRGVDARARGALRARGASATTRMRVRARGIDRPPIEVGETLPGEASVAYVDDDGALVRARAGDLWAKRRVVVFAVPGAFTPTCSNKHLPGYVRLAEEFRARGVDDVMCVSVNDAFVMNAWGETAGARKARVRMVADGSATLARAMGTDLDLSEQGMGTRSRRFAMIAYDGVVEYLAMENGTKYETSGADEVLEHLKKSR
ncbi:Thioredoxin-like fold [Ostreococcus tauri]|uniref:Glutaredoxin-dependent peroxiredoxin n=2 Tax=Ostreococcus tauri TaxID=70448 RepID=A0A090M6D9_OSTTA|nr:Thioredoxin-like fold [Ostreococcus tauri]CEF99761.1 Thioredoxin-like fold [Ostreococcus tauri]|eukprot:XP_003082173.2 Thioredoxin-like fold [Ostreococcus tauri]